MIDSIHGVLNYAPEQEVFDEIYSLDAPTI